MDERSGTIRLVDSAGDSEARLYDISAAGPLAG